jgi:hypothetical protein
MGCNPISLRTDIGGPFIHHAYRESKNVEYMYLLLVILSFGYFYFYCCFYFHFGEVIDLDMFSIFVGGGKGF